uniref:Uncharacterized protein LOC107417659 n=1 Tax=Rhizophora mucronata TaxID=61149 RepID=A0A2P2JX99_RHIMU
MESPSPSSQNDHADRFVPTGETPIQRDSSMVQPLSPQDERIVSANSSPDAAITGPVRDARERPPPSDAVGDISIVPPINAYASHERMAAYRGWYLHPLVLLVVIQNVWPPDILLDMSKLKNQICKNL